MGENIGAAARAMHNFGLHDLRLVRPRDVWPNPKAVHMASGADHILEAAQVHATVEEAIGDLHHVFAVTARSREVLKPVVEPARAAADMEGWIAVGESCGLLFGREKAGLNNDDVALSDAILSIPANPAFSSLNLAQAVVVLAYEWMQVCGGSPVMAPANDTVRPATKDELVGLFEQLEGALEVSGFLHPPERIPATIRTLRNMFQRWRLNEHDVRVMRGIVSSLSDSNGDDGPKS